MFVLWRSTRNASSLYFVCLCKVLHYFCPDVKSLIRFFFSFSILLPLLLFLSSPPFFSSCCGEVSPRCLAIKGLCAAAAVGSLQKLSSHSSRPLCDFMPHLCEQTLWALLRQSTPTTLQFFASFFFSRNHESLLLSWMTVTQNSFCFSGTPGDATVWMGSVAVLLYVNRRK